MLSNTNKGCFLLVYANVGLLKSIYMKINCDYTNDKQRRKEELAGFYYPTDLLIRYVWYPDRVE